MQRTKSTPPFSISARRRRRLWVSGFGASIALTILLLASPTWAADSAPGVAPESRPAPARDFMRGMTVSCPRWGPIWGSPKMAEALEQLDDLGVEWVSIHPYASINRSGEVRYRQRESEEFLARAVAMADAAGIELFWKPHLAYWGSFEWRGAIDFGGDEAAWSRFFETYGHFIVEQAKFAERHKVPLLSIGLEYEATTHHEAPWRKIIAAVRAVYSGKLTYAANWDRLDKVPFWDALDLIGVQGYFPLSGGTTSGGTTSGVTTSGGSAPPYPSRQALSAAWDGPLATLSSLSERYDKPVVFAEIGYDLSARAAAEPWLTDSRDNADNRALRRLLMEVALERLEGAPNIVGMFWWKWIPGASPNRDFAMQHPEAQATLRRAWGPGAVLVTAD